MTDADLQKLGAIYTKAWIADFMLDLVGYRAEVDLCDGTILEPCCGDGAFAVPIALRLVESARRQGRPLDELASNFEAYDIDPAAVQQTRSAVIEALVLSDVPSDTAERLAIQWIRTGDFLLDVGALPGVRWAVGNPPYVRTEDVDADTMDQYRLRWPTMRGRADVYVGFFEAALRRLIPGGSLVFICADRWMKNQYGSGLRELIRTDFALDLVLDLHDVDVFVETVAAYPAIVAISKTDARETVFAKAGPRFDSHSAVELVRSRQSGSWAAPSGSFEANVMPLTDTGLSWAIAGANDLTLIAGLERRFPTIGQTGVQIGVGVATGADSEYIVSDDTDIEPERLLRLVGPADIKSGTLDWSGRQLINTFEGVEVASFAAYPRMAAYFRNREERLKSRYVAKKNPEAWWRTIDRPNTRAYMEPKLLLADIKDRIEPVLDEAGFTPMHSLYFLRSSRWDLNVLGGLLLSDIAATFLTAYSVRMASGRMRVSSQYLKRLRVPAPEEIPSYVQRDLAIAFVARDRHAASNAAAIAYGLVAGRRDDS